MLTLVIGGAGSGKSAFAESDLRALASGVPRVYLATMPRSGAEAEARIARHRRVRAGAGFLTVERERDLASLALPARAAVLLEDLGNLAANELFTPDGLRSEAEAREAALAGVFSVLRRASALTVVTNEIFCGGAAAAPETERYFRLLAGLNRALAAKADRVIEVVCGLPLYWKGEGCPC